MQNTKFHQVWWNDNDMLMDKLLMDKQTKANKILYLEMILAHISTKFLISYYKNDQNLHINDYFSFDDR